MSVHANRILGSAEYRLLDRAMRENLTVEVETTSALYECCGKGWKPRVGYTQVYRGKVRNLAWELGVFSLLNPGLGSGLTYQARIEISDCAGIEILDEQDTPAP